jgi:hypothetical protein
MIDLGKKLIQTELVKEIISIRLDTLWKMLALKKEGLLPEPYEEGATGKLDNKGGIFIPGGVVYQDVDEVPISYNRQKKMSSKIFREKIREAMHYDNATLLFPDGIATGINLDSGFFSKAARRIFMFKKAAFRRKKKIISQKYFQVMASDIIRSHCPTYMPQPYGARTRISTCAAVGLIDPPMFFSYCGTQLSLTQIQIESFAKQIDIAQDPVKSLSGKILYQPCLVVCHDTRYKENNLTGLTRLIGFGKLGEFATVSFEQINTTLLRELKRKDQSIDKEDVLANYGDMQIVGILRVYSPTKLGKRLQRYSLNVISPVNDLFIDLEQIKQEAFERYHINLPSS